MVHAAAPCPPDIKRRMIEWWGDSIWEYYAATEGGGTIVSPQEWMKKPGTVGKAWPNAELKIFDDEGNEQPTGTPGTVYMLRGQADFEYYKDKEKTDKARRGKYFTVGDIGYLDADGYLFLVRPQGRHDHLGRREHLPRRDRVGAAHAPEGRRRRRVRHPARGVGRGGEGGGRADRGRRGAATRSRTRSSTSCKERLAKYKTPKTIDYVTEMPRDPNGKLYKRKLRDPYWEGRTRNI